MFGLLFVAGLVSDASAQTADSNWTSVNATVVDRFDFRIDAADHPDTAPASYDFGTVSHSGMNGGVKIAGSVYYTKNGAFSWTVVSAPRRSVDIVLRNPTKQVEPAPGGMALDQLAIELTVANQASGGSGTSTGLTPVAAGEVLVDDVLAGNATSRAAGQINLEIHVDGNDRDGLNIWLLELEATGI